MRVLLFPRRAAALASLLLVPSASALLLVPGHASAPLLRRPRSALAACDHPASALDDEALDRLIKSELEAAFEGMKVDTEDDEEMLAVIQAQTDVVLSSVLSKLDADNDELRTKLNGQIESVAAQQREEVEAKYAEMQGKLRGEVDIARTVIREEAVRLKGLKQEYDELSKPTFDRTTIVSGISFLAGAAYLSQSINLVLSIVLGAVDDPSMSGVILNAAINGVLGAVGVGYYFFRRSQSE